MRKNSPSSMAAYVKGFVAALPKAIDSQWVVTARSIPSYKHYTHVEDAPFSYAHVVVYIVEEGCYDTE